MPTQAVCSVTASGAATPPPPPMGRSISAKLADLVRWSPSSTRTRPAVEEAAAAAVTDSKPCPYSAVRKRPGVPYEFTMPLHYPRYTREQYLTMPEWQLDRLLEEYGIPASSMGRLQEKRDYAIGAFIWS